jgi:hypothetical protein
VLIPAFVEAGLTDEQIAHRMGWTVGTLRATCSQLKISLRRKIVATPHVVLPQAVFNQLHHHTALMGTSVPALASDSLKVIAEDRLFDAVLDRSETVETRASEAIH